ncbi:hypothetical protein ETAA8_60810 [Anatilimnocola aggregata]|uniref:Uncharacterized protein n=1 Tax=Anatilimnocola aggregata TaxID=2528021 RepID=A0A517YL42_9BACT|nr:hypothetical protein [Anatilimnocola aggregata]QDU30928.1 hypothetical protein ETAA8_60810 [Anatilimnocola aggregata]
MFGRLYSHPHALTVCLSTFLLVSSAACTQEDLDAAKEQLKNVQQTVAKVTPLAETGVNLGPQPAIKTEDCFAKFIPGDSQRSSVLQLTSYKSPTAEDYPAVFFRATLTATNRAQLADQSIAGELYVQTVKGGPLWSTAWEKPPQFKVSAVGEWSITIDVQNIEMSQVDQDAKATFSGQLVGAWK